MKQINNEKNNLDEIKHVVNRLFANRFWCKYLNVSINVYLRDDEIKVVREQYIIADIYWNNEFSGTHHNYVFSESALTLIDFDFTLNATSGKFEKPTYEHFQAFLLEEKIFSFLNSFMGFRKSVRYQYNAFSHMPPKALSEIVQKVTIMIRAYPTEVQKIFFSNNYDNLINHLSHKAYQSLSNLYDYYCFFLSKVWNDFSVKIPDSLNIEQFKNIKNVLFGNGNSIRCTLDFLNSRIIEAALIASHYTAKGISMEKHQAFIVKLNQLKDFHNYLIDYLSPEIILAFIYDSMPQFIDTETHSKYYFILENANTVLTLYSYIAEIKDDPIKHKDINQIGIESFLLLEKCYIEFSETAKRKNLHDYNPPIVNSSKVDWNVFWGVPIQLAEQNVSVNIHSNCFDNIFTTNYDRLLEQVFGAKIHHLHGALEEQTFPIVLGQSHIEKLDIISKNKLENELNRLRLIAGNIGIVGYSASMNDEHIHKVLRENGKIEKIYFFDYGLKEKTKAEKERLKGNIFRTLGYGVNCVEIYDVSEFYKFLECWQ